VEYRDATFFFRQGSYAMWTGYTAVVSTILLSTPEATVEG